MSSGDVKMTVISFGFFVTDTNQMDRKSPMISANQTMWALPPRVVGEVRRLWLWLRTCLWWQPRCRLRHMSALSLGIYRGFWHG